MRRSVLLLPAMAATLVTILVGCSDETAGNATPGGDGGKSELPTLPGGTDDTNPTDTGTSEPSSDGPLKDKEPCDLVTDQTQARLKLANGTSSKERYARVCRWDYETTGSDSFSVSLSIFDALGVKDIDGADSSPKSVQIGGHDAVTWTWQHVNCNVTIATSESSRVDFTSSGSVSQQACQVAMQLAQAIEPELP